MKQKRLIFEIPSNWKQLGPNIFSLPVADVPPLFSPTALMEFTRGVDPTIVDILCDKFVESIQKQQVLSGINIHLQEIETDPLSPVAHGIQGPASRTPKKSSMETQHG